MTRQEAEDNYNQDEIQESVQIVTDLINNEVDQLGETKSVFVGGFS